MVTDPCTVPLDMIMIVIRRTAESGLITPKKMCKFHEYDMYVA